ncbi:LysR family transcriptional regulator [Phenylobacterium sp.]|uniref:LysR family transcriptional regulator n=1 Tax=Phenylobacterium sp. TaxID=1871053 RepID=UPI0025E88F72|nr:LysR family transcriptional regulator [Phenylobacterium sp.]
MGAGLALQAFAWRIIHSEMSAMQALNIFIRVVEAGSFTGAARAIGTTPSAVSKSMARLERRLGARLFVRSTRAFALTPEGEAYFERIAPLVRAVEEATEVLHPTGAATGRLRLSMPADFGRVLVDALTTRFHQAHPGLQLDVTMTDRRVDLIREGYDAVIRVGRVPDTGLIARPLGALSMVLVASPRYLVVRGAPRSVEALADHTHVRYLLGGRPYPISIEGREVTPPPGPFDADSGEAMRIAARNGLGVAQLLRASVADELASGELVVVLPDHPLPPAPVQILHAFGRAVPSRAQALFGFLEAEMPRWR